MSGDEPIHLTREQKNSIGKRIRIARKMKNLSIAELAFQSNMSEEQLERMENGDFELFDDGLEFLN